MKNFNIIFIFLLLTASAAFAKKYSNVTQLSNGGIVVSAPAIVAECDGYSVVKQSGNPSLASTDEVRSFRLDKPYALIKLSIPQLASYTTPATGTIEGTVTYEHEVNGQIKSVTKTLTLSVSVDATGAVKDIDYVKIDGALKATFVLTQVNIPGLFVGAIELSVSCEGDIYRFLNVASTVSGVHYTAPQTRTSDDAMVDGNLYVSWDAKSEAEYYELEWTFVSNQGVKVGETLAKNELLVRDQLFKHNSSRIVTQGTGYFIPLVYEKGLIVFRVRAVGKNISEGKLTDVKSTWSILDNRTSLSTIPDACIFTFDGLETNLNWQSSISFAEEGKNKASVSYHDGSLRNRQTVTRMNTDERAIAGETLYDHNGRPVIQVLPAPIVGSEENNLHYRPHLNVKDGAGKIVKADYDIATPANCEPLAPKLDSSSGASRYYSSQNGFGTNGNTGQNMLNKNLVPRAKNYPYTQTFYTNDNTGRISIQSGVGETHKLGSGKETKYMYGAPLQDEVSRLFGNQVGLSGHYKKNTVIDANGQVSVSYLDLDGKVIATALAGNNDTGLDALNGENARSISSNLINVASNILDSDERGRTLQYDFTVTTPSAYTFNYDMSAETHAVKCTSLTNPLDIVDLEMASVFDATVSVYDACKTPVGGGFFNASPNFDDGAATQTGSIDFTIQQENLPIGEYRLVKSIRINQAKLNNYLNAYMTNNEYTCVLKDDHFIAEELAAIDFSGCGITCDECKAKITTVINEIEAGGQVELSGEEKMNLYDRCNSLCLKNVTCLSSLYGMVAGMGPDGQYGKIRMPDNDLSVDMNNLPTTMDPGSLSFPTGSDPAIVPEKFPLSIFNSNNTLRPNLIIRNNNFPRADWRRPLKVTASGIPTINHKNQHIFSENLVGADYEEINYLNEDGTPAMAIVQRTAPDVYVPAVTNASLLSTMPGQDDPDILVIPIKYLADVKDFLVYWKPYFANYLVPYHPEWTYFVECSGRTAINEYEEKLVQLNAPTDQGSGALFFEKEQNSNYYLANQFAAQDPLITTYRNHGKFGGLIANLEYKLANYRLNTTTSAPNDYYSMAQAATIAVNCPNPELTCKRPDCENGKFAADDIEEWSAFRASYLTERQKVLREISTVEAIAGRYYNGCIGNKNFPGSVEQARMNGRYNPAPTLPELLDQIETICEVDPGGLPNPYQDLSLHLWYGERLTNLCEYRPSYLNQFSIGEYYLMLEYIFNHPAYDPYQTCNSNQLDLYKNKVRAFYPQVPFNAAMDGSGEKCYEIVQKPDGTFEYVLTDCNMALLDQTLLLQNANQAREYSRCGQCPITSEVRTLIETLIGLNVLGDGAPEFNCINSAKRFTMGTELQSYINNSLSANALLDYSSVYSGNTLTGTIAPAISSNGDPLKFTLDFSGSGLPPSTLGDPIKRSTLFSKLKIASIQQGPADHQFNLKMYVSLNRALTSSFNELHGSTGLLAGAEASNFIPSSSANQTVYNYEFIVPGTLTIGTNNTPVDLSDCEFRPVCVTSSYPNYVQNLLNTLAYQDNTVIDQSTGLIVKPYELASGTTREIVESDLYDLPVRYLLNKTQKNAAGNYVQNLNDLLVSWTCSTSTSPMLNLHGTLSYTEASVAKSLEIIVSPKQFPSAVVGSGNVSPFDFSNIRYFANIRPFDNSCLSGTCESNKYEADAVVAQTIGGETVNVFYRVVIEVIATGDPQPKITSCKKVGP